MTLCCLIVEAEDNNTSVSSYVLLLREIDQLVVFVVNMATKWGIAGSGKICHDFVLAITATLSPQDHEIVAVGDFLPGKAKEFAQHFKIPKCYESFEELARDPEVKIVYVGTINPKHYELTKFSLEQGKHVLCEKPMCLRKENVEELVGLAKKKQLFLMEGMWSRFFPTYRKLRETLNAGVIGEVYHIQAELGIAMADVPRITQKSLGGGAFLDIGLYGLNLALLVFGKPSKVIAIGHMNQNGVDDSSAVAFMFPGGKLATMTTDIRVDMENEAKITGSKGTIVLSGDFHHPTRITTPEGVFNFPLPETEEKFLHGNSCGLRYEAEEVARCLREGLLECPMMTHEDSLILAEIEDQVLMQLAESQ